MKGAEYFIQTFHEFILYKGQKQVIFFTFAPKTNETPFLILP